MTADDRWSGRGRLALANWSVNPGSGGRTPLGAGVFAYFSKSGSQCLAQPAGIGCRQVRNDASSGSTLLLEGQNHPEIVTALTVVGEPHRPARRWAFLIIVRMVIDVVIDRATHDDTVPAEVPTQHCRDDAALPIRLRGRSG